MKKYTLILLLIMLSTAYATGQTVRRVRNGIILVDTGRAVRALEPYKASADAGNAYAAIVNKYKQKFPELNVYCMVIPNAIAFYCPDSARAWTQPERPVINNLHGRLSQDVRKVDIYDTLQAHAAEPIYSRTDHHWSPLGAYYAAREFARVADVPFMPLSGYERRVIRDYVGSMSRFSRDPAVKQAPEEFVYYVPQTAFSASRINYRNVSVGRGRRRHTVLTASQPEKFEFFRPYGDGSAAAYCVFMGGDLNTTTVTTDAPGGRRLLILKDSYGNALPSYLFAAFEQIHVVDCRYFLQNIGSYISQNGITDLLFANNLIHASMPKICQNYERFLTQ
jgi:hypothetical protein